MVSPRILCCKVLFISVELLQELILLCYLQLVKYTRNGRAYFFQTPHLGSTAGAAAMAALYVKASKDWYFVEEKPALIKGAPFSSLMLLAV